MRVVSVVLALLFVGSASAARLTVRVQGASGPVADVGLNLVTYANRHCVDLDLKPRARQSVKESNELATCRTIGAFVRTDTAGQYTYATLQPGWYGFLLVRSLSAPPSSPIPVAADSSRYSISLMQFGSDPLEFHVTALPFEVHADEEVVRVVDVGALRFAPR